MPIYEYQCTACNHALEALQKMSDAPLTECPQCGQSTLQKLVSAASFQLKGSGWYQTDFKGNPAKPAPETAENTPSPSSASTPASPAASVAKES